MNVISLNHYLLFYCNNFLLCFIALKRKSMLHNGYARNLMRSIYGNMDHSQQESLDIEKQNKLQNIT